MHNDQLLKFLATIKHKSKTKHRTNIICRSTSKNIQNLKLTKVVEGHQAASSASELDTRGTHVHNVS